jgi:hypothetical protein
MSNVTIKIDTGFVGGIHEEELDIDLEEWKALDAYDKYDIYRDVTNNYINTYAVDEDDNIID